MPDSSQIRRRSCQATGSKKSNIISDPTWYARVAGSFALAGRLPRKLLGTFRLSSLATCYCAPSRMIATWSYLTRESLEGPVVDLLGKLTRLIILAAQKNEPPLAFRSAEMCNLISVLRPLSTHIVSMTRVGLQLRYREGNCRKGRWQEFLLFHAFAGSQSFTYGPIWPPTVRDRGK